METLTSSLLKEAKKNLGVKSDKEFCEMTGASPAVVRRWRDGTVDAVNSSVVNVYALCAPLNMTLDEIYSYLTTGERPKKNGSWTNPAIARAYAELGRVFNDLGVKMGLQLGSPVSAPNLMSKPSEHSSELLAALFDQAAADVDKPLPQILNEHLEPVEAASAIAAYDDQRYDRAAVVIICAALSLERDRHGLPPVDPQTALLLWSRPGGGPLNASLQQEEGAI